MKNLTAFVSLGLMLFACSTTEAVIKPRAARQPLKTLPAITPEKQQAPVAPAKGPDVGHHHSSTSSSDFPEFTRYEVILDVQQRFYAFQNATSGLKQAYHNPDPAVFTAALALFKSFFIPSINDFNIYTENTVYSFTSLAQIATAYTEFAACFNGFSQHFSTNCVVTPDLCNYTACLTSGGGEWASLDFSDPYEQITISNFEVTWQYVECIPGCPNWYITSYAEYGDRLFSLCPPCGGFALTFARLYPGATPECYVDGCAACACDACPEPTCETSTPAAAPKQAPVQKPTAAKKPAAAPAKPAKVVVPAKVVPAKNDKAGKATPAKKPVNDKADPLASVGKLRKK